MRSLAALLAAVVVATALAGCDDGGAEPGASREATLVLDFQPNAVHAGLYSALRRGHFEDEGIELEIREPSATTDAPKLLQAGRAEFAIMDINDFGLALERGIELRAVSAVVQRPLAAVIVADRVEVRRPRDLEGGRVGVTGLPSDEAVLDAVLKADGADPAEVERVTIGFDSVAALSAGRLDAAMAFWNAEGVALQRLGIPTREFRVDELAAPSYPELLVVTSRDHAARDPASVEGVRNGLARAHERLHSAPATALTDLLQEVPALDAAEQRAQFQALLEARAFGSGEVTRADLDRWLRFASAHGLADVGVVRAALGEAF